MRIVPLWIVTVLFASAAAADLSTPSISVSGPAIRVANVTPANRVVLFVVTLANDEGLLRQRTITRMLVDSDGDGIVTYAMQESVPLRSIVIAIDVASGHYQIGGRDDYPVTILPVPEALRTTGGPLLADIDLDMRAAVMVIVRPGSAANNVWSTSATEGGEGDADHTLNGKLTLDPRSALALEDAATAPGLAAGDVVAVIDSGRMETFVAQVGR